MDNPETLRGLHALIELIMFKDECPMIKQINQKCMANEAMYEFNHEEQRNAKLN
jgi:hypothetical protein